MTRTDLTCRDERRRARAAAMLNGIDAVEVSEDQRTLTLWFFDAAPEDLQPGNVSIAGGVRIPRVAAVAVNRCPPAQPDRDSCLEVVVEAPGDFSIYTLSLVELDAQGHPSGAPLQGFDPRYSQIDFSFKVDCPSDLDCARPASCPPEPRHEPDINYLAKDYASFRQLMLDRLAVIAPKWQERHVPDLGITLVEILAYVADYLSYHQDAVATEAYLETARRRISVRRHVRLVDYCLHEGCNARAWIHIHADDDFTGEDALDPTQVYFVSADENVSALSAPVLTHEGIAVPFDAYEVFEPIDRQKRITLRKSQNEIQFHTWGDAQCCLPKGSTAATLKDVDRALSLEIGNVLLFEEVSGAATGNPADADPARRHFVRLTAVSQTHDPVENQAIVNISWGPEDALPFALCVTAIVAGNCALEHISVARGNILLVDHGRTIADEVLDIVPVHAVEAGCQSENCPGEITITPGPFAPVLQQGPITFALPYDATLPASGTISAALDPRAATPAISIGSIPPRPDGGGPLYEWRDLTNGRWEEFAKHLMHPTDLAARYLRSRLPRKIAHLLDQGRFDLKELRESLEALQQPWKVRPDLFGSTSADRHAVLEIDNEGRGHLRFGRGGLGRTPAAGTAFRATYRVGNGPAGNVGAESITRIVFRAGSASGFALRARNPLAASGGIVPETLAEARLCAPFQFRREQARAITAADYARFAQAHPKVQRAAATLRWTGAGHEAIVAIDQLGQPEVDRALLDDIAKRLDPCRRIGHAVRVVAARQVPLRLGLEVTALPEFISGHVKAALLDVLSNRVLPDGRRGLFHSDNLTFGQSVCASAIVAACHAIPGVRNVTVTKLERLHEGDAGERDRGELTVGPLEIARLDNDASLPEHGQLEIDMKGGR